MLAFIIRVFVGNWRLKINKIFEYTNTVFFIYIRKASDDYSMDNLMAIFYEKRVQHELNVENEKKEREKSNLPMNKKMLGMSFVAIFYASSNSKSHWRWTQRINVCRLLRSTPNKTNHLSSTHTWIVFIANKSPVKKEMSLYLSIYRGPVNGFPIRKSQAEPSRGEHAYAFKIDCLYYKGRR